MVDMNDVLKTKATKLTSPIFMTYNTIVKAFAVHLSKLSPIMASNTIEFGNKLQICRSHM